MVFKDGSTGSGVEMNQYMDELLSLQGTGNEIVQVGIAKYTGSQGVSWIFIYTDSDHSSGGVVGVGSLWGGGAPVAGHRYHFHIEYRPTPPLVWEYCIKDVYTTYEGCWTAPATWYNGQNAWFGGETQHLNTTMGAKGDYSTFRTYKLRQRDYNTGWLSYITATNITNICGGSGDNSGIVRCNELDTLGWPGFYVWTQ